MKQCKKDGVMAKQHSEHLVSAPGASIFPCVPDTALYSLWNDVTVCGLLTLQRELRVSSLA